MLSKFSRFIFPAVMMCAVTATSTFATPVSGQLNMTGDANVGATVLTFLCDIVVTGSTPCPAGSGNFLAGGAAAQTGSFIVYANDPGFIKSINQAAQPINANFLLSNFITFSPTGTVPSPDVALDLTFLFTGTFGQAQCGAAPAPGQTCTPIIPALVSAANPLGLSPFNLSNTQTGSDAVFSVAGNARRISTGELTPFNGTFSAQFTSSPGTTNGSFQSLLGTISGGGTITTSYSSTFNATAVPEPGTLTMLLGGLSLAGLARIRRRRQK